MFLSMWGCFTPSSNSFSKTEQTQADKVLQLRQMSTRTLVWTGTVWAHPSVLQAPRRGFMHVSQFKTLRLTCVKI